MPGSAIDSQLVLHVLGLLVERPMHQYTLRRVLAERYPAHRSHTSAGSIFALITRLQKEGWVDALRTEQEGNHRPRTVFGITIAGMEVFRERIDAQIREVTPGMSPFADAIAYLGALSPEQAVGALLARLAMIRQHRTALAGARQAARAEGVADLHMLEVDLLGVQLEGEERWIGDLIARIESGNLPWPAASTENPT